MLNAFCFHFRVIPISFILTRQLGKKSDSGNRINEDKNKKTTLIGNITFVYYVTISIFC
jgi:hypothetical protein